MSKRAEERALEAYPITMVQRRYDGIARSDDYYDSNRRDRYCFQEGYEQAEKDLALSIDDIEKIHVFLYAVKNNKQGVFTFTRLSDEQYKEVLRRFKEAKK